MTFWVGLTGGIGSGKSTVANYFAELGIPVLNADQVVHQLTAANGIALPLLWAQWGKSIFYSDRTLNREALRQIVFNQPEQRQILEEILHPLIWQSLQQAQHNTANTHHYGLIEIPLLIEKPVFQQLVQFILIVETPEATRIQRIQNRSGLNNQTIHAIISQQADAASRKQSADQIIYNDGEKSALKQQIMDLHHFYQALNLP